MSFLCFRSCTLCSWSYGCCPSVLLIGNSIIIIIIITIIIIISSSSSSSSSKILKISLSKCLLNTYF